MPLSTLSNILWEQLADQNKILPVWHCLGVRYQIPRLRGYGTGHRATPMRTVSGSGSLLNNYSSRLGIQGCVSVPARICSNCYLTNKNLCWKFTLLRPPSLIICIYCHTIQTSISLYKRYKIFNRQEWKRYNLSYFIPFIFSYPHFFNKVMK